MMKSRTEAPYVGSASRGSELHRFLNLLWALVIRELKGRYRRSILGPAWAILQPLLYMLIFTFIRGVLNIYSEGVPYVIFTYSALVPWTFFSNAVSWCGPSIIGNGGILKKVAIAREVFPAASVMTSLVDLLIASVILIAMMIGFKVPVGWSLLWWPVLVMMTTLLALGIGLGVAALGTFKRDIIFAVPFVMQFWLLATPILYPLGKVPEKWHLLYTLNPMVGLVEGFRSVMIKGLPPDLGLLSISLLGIVLVWLGAWPLFRYLSQYFADVL
jgi:lipopolysaccharide transport system permease protein